MWSVWRKGPSEEWGHGNLLRMGRGSSDIVWLEKVCLGSKKEKRPRQKAQALGWKQSDMSVL